MSKLPIPESEISPDWYVNHLKDIAAKLPCNQATNVVSNQVGSKYNYYCAERAHGGPVCFKQCDTCGKLLP